MHISGQFHYIFLHQLYSSWHCMVRHVKFVQMHSTFFQFLCTHIVHASFLSRSFRLNTKWIIFHTLSCIYNFEVSFYWQKNILFWLHHRLHARFQLYVLFKCSPSSLTLNIFIFCNTMHVNLMSTARYFSIVTKDLIYAL